MGPVRQAANVDVTPRQREVLEVLTSGRGVYLHGPPGAGKTMLLDLAHRRTPSAARWHFTEFFRDLHEEIATAGGDLDCALRGLTGGAKDVFFDEFHLHDVADAIFVRRALQFWAERQVRVVATSNYAPAELLPNPLFHHAAEPVAELLRGICQVIVLDEGVDHRTTARRRGGQVCFAAGAWAALVDHEKLRTGITIHGRVLRVVERPAPPVVAETTFRELCVRPWSAADYVELATVVEAIEVHDLPAPAGLEREAVQRLANLVDVTYDRGVPLTVHCSGRPDQLRDCAVPPLDVERTISRLAELVG